MRKHTSPIWLLSKMELIQLAEESDSVQELLIKIGLAPGSGNHKTLNRRCEAENIDISALKERGKRRSSAAIAARGRSLKIPLEEVLIEKSSYSRNHLKPRLIEEGILKEECSACRRGPEWEGKPLSLVLDHINGVSDDNRPHNLRFLCPNCNSQTETFSGRNAKKETKKCIDCGAGISRYSTRCLSCSAKTRPRKVQERPSKEQLLSMLETMTKVDVGKHFGVSSTTISGWIKLES